MGNPRATGRPRDPRIETEARAAVRSLLAEGGYAAVTGAAVAARAGTTKAALYRRWPALPHLVHEAVFPGELALDLSLGADLATDLAGVVRGARDALCTPVATAALPGLLAATTVTAITLVGYTAMSGLVGGGGLGDLAVRYGYQRYQPDVMAVTVVLLLILVQLLQMVGDRLVIHFSRK